MTAIDAPAGVVVPVLVAFGVFAVVGAVLAVIDVREHRLPNRLVLPLYPTTIVLFAVASAFGAGWATLLRAVVGGVAMFVFYAAMRGISRRGMGGGDVKLAGVVGLYLGWVGWGALVVGAVSGFLIGGAAALVLLAARRASRSTAIPFGPFLLVGAWIGILAGEQLSRAYLGL